MAIASLAGCIGPHGPTPRFPAGTCETHAQVTVLRSRVFAGGGRSLPVVLDGWPIAHIHQAEYVTFFVEPGIHGLGSETGSVAMPFEAGKSVFFRIPSADWHGPVFEQVEAKYGYAWTQKYDAVPGTPSIVPCEASLQPKSPPR
jgi:hypothetical protein